MPTAAAAATPTATTVAAAVAATHTSTPAAPTAASIVYNTTYALQILAIVRTIILWEVASFEPRQA